MSTIAASWANREQATIAVAPRENGSRWSWIVRGERSSSAVELYTLIGPEPTQRDPETRGVKDFVTISRYAPEDGDGEVLAITLSAKSGVRNALLTLTAPVNGSQEATVEKLTAELQRRIIAMHEATDNHG